MSQPSESPVQIAQQAQVLTEVIEPRTADSKDDTTPPGDQQEVREVGAIPAEDLTLTVSAPSTKSAPSTNNDGSTSMVTLASSQNGGGPVTPIAVSHDQDPVLDNELEDEEPNVDSDGNVPPLLYRPKSPDNDEEEGASEHPQRIVSDAVRALGLGMETGLLHTTPHLVPGYHMENDLHDIPLPRVPPSNVVQRQQRMNFIELSEQQSIAHADNLRASDLECPLTTLYPDNTDLFSLMGSNWYKGGPQCWTDAIDLCILFAEKGNLYNAPSQFQIRMLTSMPRVRYPKLSAQWKRQGDWDFNWERNDNIDSFLAYMCGTMLKKEEWCDDCKKGKGMMIGCVVIEGCMQEACTNHWRNSKQSKCQSYRSRKEASRKRPRPRSDDGGDGDGDDGDDVEGVIDLTENVSVTQQSSQQKAPRTPRKKRNATPLHDFSPINRPPTRSSTTLPPHNTTTVSKKAKKEIISASAQKKVKIGKMKSGVTLRSLEQLRQEGLINEDSLAKQIRHARTFTPKQINEQRLLHLNAVQGADNDITQLESNIHDAEEAMRSAQAALQLTREKRLKAEKALALVDSLEEGEQQVDMTLGDF